MVEVNHSRFLHATSTIYEARMYTLGAKSRCSRTHRILSIVGI